MKLKPAKRYSYKINKPTALHELSEDELAKRLYLTVVAIFLFIVLGVVTVVFFAPKFGSLFEFLTKDTLPGETRIAPSAPVLVNVPQTTKGDSINLEGFSEPGVTVKLFVNGPEVKTVISDAEGKFTFDNVNLIKGKNILFAKSVGDQNMESEPSETFNISYDDKAPEIDMESPEDGDTVRNLDKRILIKGKTSEKAEIRVNGRLAITKPDLTFEILLGVEEGDIEVEIEAMDEAGNISKEIINVKYVKSS